MSSEPYVVFSKRDLAYEQNHSYARKGLELYDSMKRFTDLTSASAFAFESFPSLIVAQMIPTKITKETEYILAVRPDGKYVHVDYGGGRDTIRSWDVRRVKRDSIESVLRELYQERNKPRAQILGIEQKVI